MFCSGLQETASVYPHINIRTLVCAYVYMWVYARRNTHSNLHPNTTLSHKRIDMCVYMYTHTYTHTHTHSHTHTHTHTHALARMHACMCMRS